MNPLPELSTYLKQLRLSGILDSGVCQHSCRLVTLMFHRYSQPYS